MGVVPLATTTTTSLGGLLGATITIIVTTVENCVWLPSFVARAGSCGLGLFHALLFVATFELLAIVVSFGTLWFESSLANLAEGDLIMAILGAAFCWILAFILWLRTQQRRRQQRESQQTLSPLLLSQEEGYGTANDNTESSAELNGQDSDDWADLNPNGSPQPWMIVTLTIVGSLDEVSYFPAVIIGGVFTPMDLCIGTLLASIIILAIVYLFLSQCQPLIDVLDRIPLYAVVGAFAVLLTMEVAWELIMGE